MRPKPPVTLVTGGGGLLGCALKEVLPEAVFVAGRDYDLTEAAQARRMFRDLRPERVIHLAARVGGVKKNAAQNADLFEANALINTNVLGEAGRSGVLRLVSVLSSCAYPVYEDRPSTEGDLHAGMPFGGNLGYGYSKRMLDVHTRLIRERYGLGFSTITPVTMYGPNDNWDLEDGHVVGALIRKCRLAKSRGRPLEVWGGGRAVRQFVYSFDVARVLAMLLAAPDAPDSLIVAPDSGITIRDLAHAVAKAADFDGPILFDAGKPEGQLARVIESREFSRRFPRFRFTPLEEGLRATVRWFIHNFRETRPHQAAA